MKRSQITGIKQGELRNYVEEGEIIIRDNKLYVKDDFLLSVEMYIGSLEEVKSIVKGPQQNVKDYRMILILKVVFILLLLSSFIYNFTKYTVVDVLINLIFNAFFYIFVLYIIYLLIWYYVKKSDSLNLEFSTCCLSCN